MKGTVVRIAALLLAFGALGIVANALRPDGIPWMIDPASSADPGENPDLASEVAVTLDELRRHYAEGKAVFIDVRRPDLYRAGHLATAINIPARERQQYRGTIMNMIPPESVVVLYCEGRECEASNEVFRFLREMDFNKKHLKIFTPGWETLAREGGLPIVRGEHP